MVEWLALSGLDALVSHRHGSVTWGADLSWQSLPQTLPSTGLASYGSLEHGRVAFSLAASASRRPELGGLDGLTPTSQISGGLASQARLTLIRGLGVRGDMLLPIASGKPELGVSLLASRERGALRVASELGLVGTDVQGRVGARLHLPDATRLAGTAELLAHSERGLGLLGGVELYPSRTWTLSLRAGPTQGLARLTWHAPLGKDPSPESYEYEIPLPYA
jgi:hypothetical protein